MLNPFRRAISRSDFLSSEAGAITVDYVVLAAGGLGLGLMVTHSLTNGYRNLSSVVRQELEHRNTTIELLGGQGETFTGTQTLYSGDFEDGTADGWYADANGTLSVANVNGIGNALGPIDKGNGSVGRVFDVPEGADSAELTFDVYSLDGIESGETGSIYIDNTKVAEIGHDAQAKAFFRALDHGIEGLTVSAETVADNVDLGGYTNSKDSKFTVKVTKDSPGAEMRFEFQTELSADHSNESFALDNVSVTGTANP